MESSSSHYFDFVACLCNAVLFIAFSVGLDRPLTASTCSFYFGFVGLGIGMVEAIYNRSTTKKFFWMTATTFMILCGTEESELLWINGFLPFFSFFFEHLAIFTGVLMLTVITMHDPHLLSCQNFWDKVPGKQQLMEEPEQIMLEPEPIYRTQVIFLITGIAVALLVYPLKCSNSQWKGLRNLGNTCYLNTALHMLFSVPAFINSLDGKGNELTMSILKVYNEINNSIGVSVDPRSIKDAIDSLGTNFSGPRKQHDAHEFLIYLLNSVHNELIAERNESMTNEVDEYFRIHVKYSLKCTTCEATRNVSDTLLCLSIDVEDEKKPTDDVKDEDRNCLQWSVQKGLNQFFAQVEIEGLDCTSCCRGSTWIRQTLEIWPPKTLLIHLKRFVGNTVFGKNNTPVILDPIVSLGSLVAGSAATDYSITSVAHHNGLSRSSGHYTCDALREDPTKSLIQEQPAGGMWVSFDDCVASETTFDNVLGNKNNQKNAYMVLYTMVPE